MKSSPSPPHSAPGIWGSRLARRLMALFTGIALGPLLVTVFLVGKVGREQIVAAGRSTERINADAVHEAGQDFQRLGRQAVRHSSAQASAISIRATQTVAAQWRKSQNDALTATARDFAKVTQTGLDGAVRRSVATSQDGLARLSRNTGDLFTRSSRRTEQRSVGRIEAAMQAQIEARMHERARELAQHVSDHIQTHLSYLALTAEMLDVRGQAERKPILDALVRRYPMLVSVSALDGSGQEVAASAPDRLVTGDQLASRASRPDYQAGMRDAPYVGVDERGEPGRAPFLRLAVPIEKYRGKVIGVLTARLSLDDLWDSMRTTRIGKSGFASVADAQGRPLLAAPSRVGPLLQQSAEIAPLGWQVRVAQPRSEVMEPAAALQADLRRGTAEAQSEFQRQVERASTSTAIRFRTDAAALRSRTTRQVSEQTHRVFDGLARRSAAQAETEIGQMRGAIQAQERRTVRENDAQMAAVAQAASSRLAARIPPLTARALRVADGRLRNYALVIVLLSSLLSCAVALILAERLVRPILRLAQGTHAIAAGDLERRVDERAPDEIGDLAEAFNQMAESLKKSRTELQGAEAQLVQSAKLASLGTLSAGVAHELNQPVAIVRGIAQQLQSDPSLSQDALEDLELIEGQTGRMMKIIKHLRTFCRAGGYEQVEVEINQVIRDCFILIAAQLKAHGVAVDLQLSDAPLTVLADANELEQVFLNLITNARDALEGRGDARITIRSWEADGRIALEFRDNGTGVPEEIAARIFDPFFTTKDAGKGTGLGLSISHGILEKHGGEISLKNDGGAVFTLTLPAIASDNGLKRAA